jgi:glycosyltransferase involved in cell wall biosynthesis
VSKELGGAALIALRMAARINARGDRTAVWLPGVGPAEDEARHLGLPAVRYDLTGALGKGRFRSAWSNWKFNRALATYGAGIVHVHSPEAYGALRWGLRAGNVKRIVHVHIQGEIDHAGWTFRVPPELIVTCARFLVEEVRSGIPAEFRDSQRIVAVPNAVDLERYKPGDRCAAKSKLGLSQAPLVLMLANLAPHKGQETAVQAVAVLKNQGVNVNCWLAGVERHGAAAYTARLKNLIECLGVEDRVAMVGHRRDIPQLLRAADFLLLPSTDEGMPLAVLEAQASKAVVIAAPTAGIPEIVDDGRTGYLVPASDAEGYAARIAALIDEPAAQEHVAQAAYRMVHEHHSETAYCTRIDELYVELASDL